MKNSIQIGAFDFSILDDIYEVVEDMNVPLDDDPIKYGPRRLIRKVAKTRYYLTRMEKMFLSVSKLLSQYKRRLNTSSLHLDLERKRLIATDASVRKGASLRDREALADQQLLDYVRNVANYELVVSELESVLSVLKTKRTDLKDTQGRIRDQTKLCEQVLGLDGVTWGSAKGPVHIETVSSEQCDKLFSFLEDARNGSSLREVTFHLPEAEEAEEAEEIEEAEEAEEIEEAEEAEEAEEIEEVEDVEDAEDVTPTPPVFAVPPSFGSSVLPSNVSPQKTSPIFNTTQDLPVLPLESPVEPVLKEEPYQWKGHVTCDEDVKLKPPSKAQPLPQKTATKEDVTSFLNTSHDVPQEPQPRTHVNTLSFADIFLDQF